MRKTVIEKIVEHNTGKSVKPGDIAIVNGRAASRERV